MKVRKPNEKTQRSRVQPVPEAPPELDVAARALLDAGAPRHPEAEARVEASIEDPLQDWPEAAGESDRWIADRHGRGDQPDR